MGRFYWKEKASEVCLFLHRALNWVSVIFGFLGLTPISQLPKRTHASVKAEEKCEGKKSFLEKFGDVYGYPGSGFPIDKLRATEFARLNGVVYVDHAGATLHADSQLKSALEDFSSNLYGNPHSQSESSVRTADVVESMRQQVLNYCNAPAGEYTCVFTSGATAALKLVGETFPWSNESQYLYTVENHNSVLGIREYALDQGVTVAAVDVEASQTNVTDSELDFTFTPRTLQKRVLKDNNHIQVPSGEVFNLFAFPLECNFSGAKFDLNLVKYVQDGKHVNNNCRGQWMVLLDAAKGCGTIPPDLALFPADFVTISFYKIFGYPTGLGALIVRTDAAKMLKKKYFGGGTVAMSIAEIDMMKKRDKVEQWLEDGTTTFLGIAALRHGFASIARLQRSSINMHTGALTKHLAIELANLKHGNGMSVCVLHGNHGLDEVKYWGPACNQGPVVTFNLKREDGSWVGHREVEKLSVLSNIQLRTGCFCNPGACAKHLKLSQEDLILNFEVGHVCWDDHDVIHGRPTGAVRISFGYMSTFEDSWAVIEFIMKYFVETGDEILTDEVYSHTSNGVLSSDLNDSDWSNSELDDSITSSEDKEELDTAVEVESIVVYPIKSCGGFSVDAWPLSDCGLLYDREWMLQSAGGDVLTQKKVSLMSSIRTSIDLATEVMHVMAPNMSHDLVWPLKENSRCALVDGVKLCGNSVEGTSYGDGVTTWFTEALGVPCTLVRKEAKTLRSMGRPSPGPMGDNNNASHEMSFANEGQFLLLSKSSVDELNRRVMAELEEVIWRRISSMFSINEACKRTKGSVVKFEVYNSEGNSLEMDLPYVPVDALRFRPNIVVSGSFANEEDNWERITICGQDFKVLGGCNRCQMVNIDQTTGSRGKHNQPLATLASYRRQKGRIMFGILLVQDKSGLQDFEHNELETEFTKWLRTRYTRLLVVGSNVSIKRHV